MAISLWYRNLTQWNGQLSYKPTHRIYSICYCFLSFCIMLWWLIHVIACVKRFRYFFLSSVLTHLFIHLQTIEHSKFPQVLFWIKTLETSIYLSLCRQVFSFILAIHIGEVFLNSVESACISLIRNPAVAFYITINGVQFVKSSAFLLAIFNFSHCSGGVVTTVSSWVSIIKYVYYTWSGT